MRTTRKQRDEMPFTDADIEDLIADCNELEDAVKTLHFHLHDADKRCDKLEDERDRLREELAKLHVIGPVSGMSAADMITALSARAEKAEHALLSTCEHSKPLVRDYHAANKRAEAAERRIAQATSPEGVERGRTAAARYHHINRVNVGGDEILKVIQAALGGAQ